MKISTETTNNGYLIIIEGSLKNNGRYIYRSIDILEMLEFIGGILNDKKVLVKER